MNSWEALAMDSKSKTHLVRLRLKWNKNHIPDCSRKEYKLDSGNSCEHWVH